MIFLIINQADKIKFFKTTFLVANISLRIVFEIFFPILNNANINFLK